MIYINYEAGDISLLTAIAAGKMMIQHRKAGTQCAITQRAKSTVVTVTPVVDENGMVSEDIVAVPVDPQQQLLPR